MARPTKLDNDKILQAVKLIRGGCFNSTVAHFLGISDRTFYNWVKQGRQDQEDGKNTAARRFFEEVKRAEASAEASAIMGILRAGKKQWQALAWYLERKYPDRWGQKKRGDDPEDVADHLKDLVDAIKTGASV